MYSTTITLYNEDMRRLRCENARGIHSFVYSLFPGYAIGKGRRPFSFAYDMGKTNGIPSVSIYVNSENAPASGEFSSETSRILASSLSEKPISFRIITCVEKCTDGRRIPVVLPGDSAYVGWLAKKLEPSGIRLLDCAFMGTCRREVSHGERISSVHPAVFSGQMTGPRDAMTDLFVHGLGHNGSFGAAFTGFRF